MVQRVMKSTCGDGHRGDAASIPGSGRSPAGGHGDPLQSSCLENPTGGGAWRATVHGVAKSQTGTEHLIMAKQLPFCPEIPFRITPRDDGSLCVHVRPCAATLRADQKFLQPVWQK